MEIIRKTSLVIKTARTFIVHQSSSGEQIRCGQCGEKMLTARNCAVLNNISTRAVYRLIEQRRIRFVETDSKIVFVCPNCGDADLTKFSNLPESE